MSETGTKNMHRKSVHTPSGSFVFVVGPGHVPLDVAKFAHAKSFNYLGHKAEEVEVRDQSGALLYPLAGTSTSVKVTMNRFQGAAALYCNLPAGVGG